MKLVLMGAVARAHALRGEFVVVPFNSDSPIWRAGASVVLVPRDVVGDDPGDLVEVAEANSERLLGARPGPKGRLVVRLAGVSSRAAAEALKGTYLAVPVESLPDAEDEVFFYEVPGWQVVTLDGEAVGTVVRAVEGATDLLEIRPASGGPTFFVPFVDQIVREVDRDGGRVVIDALEGLLP